MFDFMKKLHRHSQAIYVAAMLFLSSSVAWAQEAEHLSSNPHTGLLAIAIALGMGLAAYGGTTGQSRAASAALEGLARNPNAANSIFVPLLLGLALIESLVLFTWVLMFLMLGKI